MSYDINKYPAKSGRVIGEDGQVYNLVDLLQGNGGGGGGTQDVNVQNWPTPPKWTGVGNILQGQVQQGEEKLIDLTAEGAIAIWIQASPDNTEPLLVGNIQGFEGAWVMPGKAEWFYYSTLYVTHSAESTQGMAYQAVKYG